MNEVVALQVNNLSKIYSGVRALSRINITVNFGEIHGIVGKNGAGKSTLVNIIAGITEPTEGEFIIHNEKIKGFTRIEARKHKVAIVTQEPYVIPDFSVAENLFTPDYSLFSKTSIDHKEMCRKAKEIFNRLKININPSQKAEELSVSEQQLLLVTKACYVDDADIIVLDEVSASLFEKDELILHEIVKEKKEEGKAILFISHRTDEILQICDVVSVIRDGEKKCTIPCSGLTKEKLHELIVGEKISVVINDCNANKASDLASKELVLKVEDFNRVNSYSNINFSLYKGEILGFAGLRGSGRTELLKSIAGIEPHDTGKLYLNDKELFIKSPVEAARKGISYLPEDREGEGLFSELSVAFNLSLSLLNKPGRKTFIRNNWEKQLTDNLIKKYSIANASARQEVNKLSGGNKQKVVIGRITAVEPQVYLLDEPTRGIDIEAKTAIMRIIKNTLCQNGSVIITEPGLEDIIKICDRILVIFQGKIIKEFSKDEFNENEIFHFMQGG
jgi:ABC-type sugar transport system ATPase subunit